MSNEVDALATVMMSAWMAAEGERVNPSYVATFADMARAVLDSEVIARVRSGKCRCGHGPEDHAIQSDVPLCLIHGDNTHCDYADDEEIAADRWDEGWIAAVTALCPYPTDQPGNRLLWAVMHMPKDNPYRPLEVVNVLDYGAKGDKVTDDSAAFQDAIDDASKGSHEIPK